MTGPADSGPGALRRRLQCLPAAQRRLALLHELASRVARFLSLPAADAVQPSSSWRELGFDSLQAVDFRSELAAQLALPLRSTLLFEHPDLDRLVTHLLAVLQLDGAPGSTAPKPVTAIPAGQEVVLCVGDSGTYGIGSSNPATHSYPAALQILLRERTKRDWTVVNSALPGHNSRDVLDLLPSQLAEFLPRVVCVTVGANDLRSCPELLPEGSTAHTIDHRESHVPRHMPGLSAALRGKPGDREPGAAAVPMARGPEWAPRHLLFRSAYDNQPVKWQATPESQAHKEEGWRRDEANDVRGALAEFELAFAAVADDAQTRQMLVFLYLKNGRSEAAAPHLQWLIDSWARDQDFATGSRLAMAFEQCGRSQDAHEVAVKVLARDPEDGLTWRCRAESELHLGRYEEASQSIAEAIRLLPDRWSYFWRHMIHFGLGNVDAAIQTIYDAYVVFNDAKVAADDLRALAASVAGSRLRSVLAVSPCEPDVQARLAQIVEDVLASTDGAAAANVLSAHLRRIATLARNAGATPVFVSYHFKQMSEDVMRTVASELEVAFVDMSQLFEQQVAPRRRAEMQAPDGHCNDEGYRLMAAIVADGLQDIVAAASSSSTHSGAAASSA